MSGSLLMMMGAARSLDAAVLAASWSNVSDDFGAPLGGSNEDRAITWSVGGARDFSIAYAGGNTVEYRINSGSWTTYTVPISLTSGQTLGWKYLASTDESGTITVTDDTQGDVLGTFDYAASGWP